MISLSRLRDSASGFLAPRTATPLASLRIGLTLVLLWESWSSAPALIQLVGRYGFVQWIVAESIVSPWMPRVGWLAAAVEPYGIDHNGAAYLAFFIYNGALCLLFLGWHTRGAALVAWVGHMALTETGNLSAYGLSAFAQIFLFYCIVMPVGECWSLDVRAGREMLRRSTAAALSLRVIQIHLCVVYLSSGLEKMRGIQWWNGEAIWRAVMQPQFAQFDLSWFAHYPLIPIAAALGTLLVEAGYPIFIWSRRTRPLWVVQTIGLHLGIGVMLGLWRFAAMMIVLTTAAFGVELIEPYVERALSRRRASRTLSSARLLETA